MNKLLVLCVTCLSLGVVRAEASAKGEVVVMATGGTIAGANARKSIGVTTLAGMLAATLVGVLLVAGSGALRHLPAHRRLV